MDIKVLQTLYEGHVFRSRLEARFAVFLDELGWIWAYEKECYVLRNGTPYLPDFYLKQIDTWIEVKGQAFTEKEIEKCELLSIMFPESTVMMMSGLPCCQRYPCFCNGQLMDATLTTYIKAKGWSSPYFGGDWWQQDHAAFDAARYARFEHGIKGIYKTK